MPPDDIPTVVDLRQCERSHPGCLEFVRPAFLDSLVAVRLLGAVLLEVRVGGEVRRQLLSCDGQV